MAKFEEVLVYLNKGYAVRRTSWVANKAVFRHCTSDCLYVTGADDTFGTEEILQNDWELFSENPVEWADFVIGREIELKPVFTTTAPELPDSRVRPIETNVVLGNIKEVLQTALSGERIQLVGSTDPHYCKYLDDEGVLQDSSYGWVPVFSLSDLSQNYWVIPNDVKACIWATPSKDKTFPGYDFDMGLVGYPPNSHAIMLPYLGDDDEV